LNWDGGQGSSRNNCRDWVGQVWWCDSNWYAIDAAAVVVGAGPPPGLYPGTETVP